MLGKGLGVRLESGEGLEFINFLLEVAGIPLAIAVAIYFLQKPLRKFFSTRERPKIHKEFRDPKVNINIT